LTARSFSRSPGLLDLEGVSAVNVWPLLPQLPRPTGGHVLVGDLTLGAWRGHQLAADVLAQLEIEPEAPEPDPDDARSPVGRRLDNLTQGDRVVAAALDHARTVASALADAVPTALYVLLPLDGAAPDRSDALFVRFVAQAFVGGPNRVFVVDVSGTPTRFPADWRIRWTAFMEKGRATPPHPGWARLVPGVLSPSVQRGLGLAHAVADALPAIAGRCRLVEPATRLAFPARAEEYQAVAAAAGGIPWLHAYAHHHLGAANSDAWAVWDHASAEADRGGYDVPVKLLDRAAAVSRHPAEAAVFELRAQGARLANSRFAVAAALADPTDDLPITLRRALHFTKGWALTMEGRTADGYRSLEAARALFAADDPSDEHLFLLNILALNRLRSGSWSEARALEAAIQIALEDGPGRWQLRYINALNRGRLEFMRENWDGAASCYAAAFATTSGVRTESDAIHESVLAARVAGRRGDRPGELAGWMRAALHWLASAAPEAIAERVLAAITSDEDPTVDEDDAVSAALLRNVRAAASAAGAPGASEPCRAPRFVSTSDLASFGLADLEFDGLSGHGWAVLGSRHRVGDPALASSAYDALAGTVGGIVTAGAGCPHPVETIAVDDGLGCGMPRTADELVELTLRFRTSAVFGPAGTGELTEAARDGAEAELQPEVGPGVAVIDDIGDGYKITFKRYRAPLELFGRAADLLGRARSGGSVGQLRAAAPRRERGAVVGRLRDLERQRVIRLRLPRRGR